jgi:hypothetical protein
MDNSTNENGFYIERAPSGNSSFVRVATVSAGVRSFIDSVNKGSYGYRVQAFNAAGVSAYSNTATVRVR